MALSSFFNKKIIVTCFIVVASFSMCNKGAEIPYVFVDIQMNLSDPEFFALNAIGNYVMVTGGVKGIVVYRKSESEFVAFERTCPYDPDCGKVYPTGDLSVVRDTCCKSEFSLVLDGAPIKPPASRPLLMYQTTYNASYNILFISNGF